MRKNIENIAIKAGEKILEIYNRDFSINYKNDKSPVTEADLLANELICNSLEKLYPDIPIISEENIEEPYSIRKDWRECWCIDPLDGTREFINRNGEFTVNIALIRDGEPVLGVIYIPVQKTVYSAEKGFGAFCDGVPIKASDSNNNLKRVVISRSNISQETEEFLEELGDIERISIGSSIKLCMIADGQADIYPRLSKTMEWDTAAGDAIVRESGKIPYVLNGEKPMVYNKESLENPWFIIK